MALPLELELDRSDIPAVLRAGGIRLLRDYVAVEVPNPKDVLKNDVWRPAGLRPGEANMPTAIEGVVVAVGPGRLVGKRFVETLTKRGQRVVFPQHAGNEVRQGFDGGSGSTFFWLYDDEILCRIEGEGEVTGVVSAFSPVVVASSAASAA